MYRRNGGKRGEGGKRKGGEGTRRKDGERTGGKRGVEVRARGRGGREGGRGSGT